MYSIARYNRTAVGDVDEVVGERQEVEPVGFAARMPVRPSIFTTFELEALHTENVRFSFI